MALCSTEVIFQVLWLYFCRLQVQNLLKAEMCHNGSLGAPVWSLWWVFFLFFKEGETVQISQRRNDIFLIGSYIQCPGESEASV